MFSASLVLARANTASPTTQPPHRIPTRILNADPLTELDMDNNSIWGENDAVTSILSNITGHSHPLPSSLLIPMVPMTTSSSHSTTSHPHLLSPPRTFSPSHAENVLHHHHIIAEHLSPRASVAFIAAVPSSPRRGNKNNKTFTRDSEDTQYTLTTQQQRGEDDTGTEPAAQLVMLDEEQADIFDSEEQEKEQVGRGVGAVKRRLQRIEIPPSNSSKNNCDDDDDDDDDGGYSTKKPNNATLHRTSSRRGSSYFTPFEPMSPLPVSPPGKSNKKNQFNVLKPKNGLEIMVHVNVHFLRRKIFRKLKMWSRAGLILGLISAFLFLVSNEISWNSFEHHQQIDSTISLCSRFDPISSGAGLAVFILQLFVTATTLAIIACQYQYWRTRYEMTVCEGENKPGEFLTSRQFLGMIFEGLVVLIHAPPGASGCLMKTELLFDPNSFAYYNVQILSLTTMLRIHLIAHFLRHHNLFARAQSGIVSSMFLLKTTEGTGIKLLVARHPLRVLGALSVCCMGIFAYLLLICERAAEHNTFFSSDPTKLAYWRPTFSTCLWFTWVCMTTVGFGDWYPLTGIGRVVAVISTASGMAIGALLIGAVASSLELAKNEQNAMQALEFLRLKKSIVPSAVFVIQAWWRYHHGRLNRAGFTYAIKRWNLAVRKVREMSGRDLSDKMDAMHGDLAKMAYRVEANETSVKKLMMNQRGFQTRVLEELAALRRNYGVSSVSQQ